MLISLQVLLLNWWFLCNLCATFWYFSNNIWSTTSYSALCSPLASLWLLSFSIFYVVKGSDCMDLWMLIDSLFRPQITYEYGRWWSDVDGKMDLERYLFHCHFVYHESHMDCTERTLGPLQWEDGDCFSCCMAKRVFLGLLLCISLQRIIIEASMLNQWMIIVNSNFSLFYDILVRICRCWNLIFSAYSIFCVWNSLFQAQ